MRVAFVNVNLKHQERECLELQFFANKCTLELGVRYLQANVEWLPGDAVEHFSLVQCVLAELDWQSDLVKFAPDVVALSALSYYKQEVHDVARWVKKSLPRAVVIVGGPYVTSEGARVLDDPAFDYGCWGEGEVTFRLFIDMLRGASSQEQAPSTAPQLLRKGRVQLPLATRGTGRMEDIPALIYRKDGHVVANERYAVADLDELKYPTSREVDPFQFANYTSLLNLKMPHMPIVTTRGCPYACVYCHDVMGKTIRYRSPESVVSEVDHWWRTSGIDTFYINDDIFNINRKRLHAIFKEFARHRRYRFAFPNGLRADLLDDETCDLLVNGGTFFAVVAIESANAEVQDRIKKYLDLDHTLKVIERFGRSGIILGAFNILGFPGETADDIRRTIDFNTAACGLKKATFFLLNPHPGTQVYEMALAEGWEPTSGSSQGFFNAPRTSTTQHVSPEQLIELRTEAYRTFYLDAGRIKRCNDQENPNLPMKQTVEFHRVDYSYIMRQFLKLQSVTQVQPAHLQSALQRLFPNDLLGAY